MPVKDILTAIAGFEMNVFWTKNVSQPIFCEANVSNETMTNVKDISVLLNHHLKEDLSTILEKSMRSALDFQSIFGL